MLILLTKTVTPLTLTPEDIQTYETNYFNYTIMNNCFLRTNILEANIDADLLCVQLFPTYEPTCNAIPQGIYIDIQVSNVADTIFRAQFQNYSYKATNQLCFTCPVVAGKRYCDFVKNTESARIFIRSLTVSTELTVGKILLAHANLEECWDQTSSQVKWSAETMVLHLESTGVCTALRDVCDAAFYQFELSFQRIGGEKVVVVIPAAGNVEELKDGSNFTVVIKYDFSGLISGAYDKLDISAYNNCTGVIMVRKSFVSLMQSYQLSEMFLEPIFTIRTLSFEVDNTPLPNAQAINDYIKGLYDKVELRFQVYNRKTGLTIYNLNYNLTEFDFTSPKHRYVCTGNEDCMDMLEFLRLQNIQEIEILLHYNFYKESKNVFYTSQLITVLTDLCWDSVEFTYGQNNICGYFQINAKSLSCPFFTSKDIDLTISVGGQDFTEKLTYNTSMSQICYNCQDQTCQKALRDSWVNKGNVQITFKYQDSTFRLTSAKEFSDNYQLLFRNIFFIGLALFGAVVALFSWKIVSWKCSPTVQKKKVVKDIKNDELL